MTVTMERSPPKDPKVRRDGLCVVCKKPRPIVAQRNFDPFCSAPCCRKYHRVVEKGS